MPYWVKLKSGEIEGPHLKSELRTLIGDGNYSAGDLVSQSEYGPWQDLLPGIASRNSLTNQCDASSEGVERVRGRSDSERQYFVRRGHKVVGPFSLAHIQEGVRTQKYTSRDKIGLSRDGPWGLLSGEYRHRTASIQGPATTSIPTISKWTIKRSLLGNYKVEFVCEQCDAELSSIESDIGQRDSCPQCGSYFVLSSSAAADVSADREQRAIKKEVAATEKQRRRDEKQQLRDEKQRQRDHEAAAQSAVTQPADALTDGFQDDSDMWATEADSDVQDQNTLAVVSSQHEFNSGNHNSNNGRCRTVTCWYCGCTSTLLIQCPYCRMVPLRVDNAKIREH
jgi:hypothetical protein